MAERPFDISEFNENASHGVVGMLGLLAALNDEARTPAEIASAYHHAVAEGVRVGNLMAVAADVRGLDGVTPDLQREHAALGILMGAALRAADRKEPNAQPPRSDMLLMQAEATHGNDLERYAPAPIFSLEF